MCIRDSLESALSRGLRVLAFARTTEAPATGKVCDASLLGFFFLADALRPDAHETLEYFYRQGVDVKILSGDHAAAVADIARRAGVRNAERYIDASTLTTEEQLRAAALEYTVFGRLTPGQKRVLIHALQQAGHSVAMTGDGVNDVLALKDADCSIAMATGSDAAPVSYTHLDVYKRQQKHFRQHIYVHKQEALFHGTLHSCAHDAHLYFMNVMQS